MNESVLQVSSSFEIISIGTRDIKSLWPDDVANPIPRDLTHRPFSWETNVLPLDQINQLGKIHAL